MRRGCGSAPPWRWSSPTRRASAAVAGRGADVGVLLGPGAAALDEGIRRDFAGESKRVDTPAGAVSLFTRGVFHACGDDVHWVDAPVDGVATVVAFLGLSPGTTVPLVVAQFPDPLSTPDWAARAGRARARLRAVVDGLASSLVVVLVEGVAPAPSRRLQATLAASQLSPARSPPTWPRWWRLPALHPYDQAWHASAWRLEGVDVVASPGAARGGLALAYLPRVRVSLPAPADQDPVR
mgnify:FL=1